MKKNKLFSFLFFLTILCSCKTDKIETGFICDFFLDGNHNDIFNSFQNNKDINVYNQFEAIFDCKSMNNFIYLKTLRGGSAIGDNTITISIGNNGPKVESESSLKKIDVNGNLKWELLPSFFIQDFETLAKNDYLLVTGLEENKNSFLSIYNSNGIQTNTIKIDSIIDFKNFWISKINLISEEEDGKIKFILSGQSTVLNDGLYIADSNYIALMEYDFQNQSLKLLNKNVLSVVSFGNISLLNNVIYDKNNNQIILFVENSPLTWDGTKNINIYRSNLNNIDEREYIYSYTVRELGKYNFSKPKIHKNNLYFISNFFQINSSNIINDNGIQINCIDLQTKQYLKNFELWMDMPKLSNKGVSPVPFVNNFEFKNDTMFVVGCLSYNYGNNLNSSEFGFLCKYDISKEYGFGTNYQLMPCNTKFSEFTTIIDYKNQFLIGGLRRIIDNEGKVVNVKPIVTLY